LVVIAIIALLISILLPSLSRARELSKRLVCASNVKGVGTSAKIYANDNNERWMIPPYFRHSEETGVDYVCGDDSTDAWPNNMEDGEVGFDRQYVSTSDPLGTGEGSSAVSVTRAFWMMVRSGDVTVKQYVCPSSGDDPDETEDLESYYDFTGYANISYGYQVPYGPRDTQPREGMDNRQIVMADKSPYYLETTPDWDSVGQNPPIDLDDSPKTWRPFNSANHGGAGNGEGQNCLYADGHASFQRIPAVGIDNDNIFTLMSDNWGDAKGGNRIHGFTVHDSPEEFPYPGQNAFGTGATYFASTDTLLYP
jgi:prepilin-type processing-associated H-X9-DG protein